MSGMFQDATSFNGDISKWQVSSVINMKNMFRNAASFNQNLCGARWVHSQAIKTDMFVGSTGSISREICTTTRSVSKEVCTSANDQKDVHEDKRKTPFLPKKTFSSTAELKSAVAAYLKASPSGDCKITDNPFCPQEMIGDWDVSSITDMSHLFDSAFLFNGDISKWDVSRVKDMSGMFQRAIAFNGDLSKWDVSRVTTMAFMFKDADWFKGDLAKWDVSRVKDMSAMFKGATSFDCDLSHWDVSAATNRNEMFLDATEKQKKTFLPKKTFSSTAELKSAVAAAFDAI